ncbi:hypothetical protein IV203_025419 [Nitzschia inconspicua]|nr:hypothetical protein IV203_028200 [Nitzschia inconspicua]KAG7362535.1 hypothetical protein IV203_025419 [Nitzschia inconspicua]
MRAKELFCLKRETLFNRETTRDEFFYVTSGNPLFFYSDESSESFTRDEHEENYYGYESSESSTDDEFEEDHYWYGHDFSDEYPEYASTGNDSFDDRSYDY